MKKVRLFMTLVALVAMNMTMYAQYTQADRIANGVLTGINSILDAQERKQQAEIQAREKAQYKPDFDAAMEDAREFEEDGKFADALAKYEEAAVLNWKYGYSDQRNITRKITSLYVPAGRTEDGPSVINNNKVTRADYSGYRFMRENPICKPSKDAVRVQILRVCCSDTETRIEMECESALKDSYANINPDAYIKGKKSGKLGIVKTENISIKPSKTAIDQPFQKLRFAIIFPPLSLEDTEFELKESKQWNFKKIPCK